MKFKTIFLIFNAVVLISFLFVFLAPLLMLGGDYAFMFLGKNWALGLAFLAVLGAMNAFFAANWRLFSYLEQEDWPALSSYLGAQLLEKGRYSSRNVKVYVNSLLLLSDLGGIEKLESRLAEKRPKALARNALLFGITKLLKGDFQAAAGFLEGYRGKRGCEDPDWIAFDLGFARLVLKDWKAAYGCLYPLRQKRDPVLRALSGYYLDLIQPRLDGQEAESAKAASAGIRESLLKSCGRKKWERLAEDAQQDIKGVVLSKMISDSSAWLFGGKDENAR
jgi:hypothetical protein